MKAEYVRRATRSTAKRQVLFEKSEEVGYNQHMTAAQAAVDLVQMERLGEILDTRPSYPTPAEGSEVPLTEKAADTTLRIPLAPSMSTEMRDGVVDRLGETARSD